GLQAAVAAVLVATLGGVEHRDAKRAAALEQAREIGDHRCQRRLAGIEAGQEIALHVVHQQRRAPGLQPPFSTRGRNFTGARQRIRRDRRQAHQDASFSARKRARSCARSSRRLILPTAVVSNASTNTTWSGTLNAASPRPRTQALSSAGRGFSAPGITKAQLRSPR